MRKRTKVEEFWRARNEVGQVIGEAKIEAPEELGPTEDSVVYRVRVYRLARLVELPAWEFGGADRFDVTAKSGGPAGAPFAPSWDILSPALQARRNGYEAAGDGDEVLGWHTPQEAVAAFARGRWRLVACPPAMLVTAMDEKGVERRFTVVCGAGAFVPTEVDAEMKESKT